MSSNQKKYLLNEKNFKYFKNKLGFKDSSSRKLLEMFPSVDQFPKQTIVFDKNKEGNINVYNKGNEKNIIGKNCPLKNTLQKKTIFKKNNSLHDESINEMSKIIEKISKMHTVHYGDDVFYTGQFKGGKPHGIGRYEWGEGEKKKTYIGEFEDGKQNGVGKFEFDNGDIYIGEFKDGKRNGIGKYMSIKGKSYLGNFKNGKEDGIGMEEYWDEHGLQKHGGEWKNGELISYYYYENVNEKFKLDDTKLRTIEEIENKFNNINNNVQRIINQVRANEKKI